MQNSRCSLVFVVTFMAISVPYKLSLAVTATIGLNFTGSTQAAGAAYPPDTMGAVGPNQIVTFTNDYFSVFDKSTGHLTQTMLNSDFWKNAISRGEGTQGDGGGSGNDERIVYDPAAERWYAITMDDSQPYPTGRRIFLGVSDTSDPTLTASGGWKALAFDGNQGDPTRHEDYPSLGFDGDGVYITGRLLNYTSATPVYSIWDLMVLSVPKSDLLAANPTLANRTLFDLPQSDAVSHGALLTVQPVIDIEAHHGGAPLYAINGTVGLKQWKLGNTDAKSPGQATLSAGVQVPVEPFAAPPSGRQPNNVPGLFSMGIAPDQVRPNGEPYDFSTFTSAMVRAGDSIWGALAVDAGGRSGVRWYEFDAHSGSIRQSGTITDPQLDLIFPSIAVNPFGDAVIGFTATGENKFPSAYAVAGSTVGGITTFGDLIELKAGANTYDHYDTTRKWNRWGDYSQTVVDPSDPHSFWTFQEFARAKDQYAVQVTQILFPGAAPHPDVVSVGPAAAYLVADRVVAGVTDGNGDLIGTDAANTLKSFNTVGELDLTSSTGNRLERFVAKFELPDRTDGSQLLQHATLRFFLERIQGSPVAPISLLHSVTDNRLTPLKSDYEDTSYTDTQLNIFQPTDAIGQYYDVDVTDLVRADYAQDGAHAFSAFRLQVNATFFEDNVSRRYFVTSAGTGRPELLLAFVPEPSSSMLLLAGLLAVLRCRGQQRRITIHA